MSTLDLLSDTAFTLFTAENDREWTAAAEALNLPLRICRLNVDFTDDAGDWSAQSGVAQGGVLWVRPDGHIALQANDASETHRRLTEAALQFRYGDERS